MTYKEAAQNSLEQGRKCFQAGDFGQAARDYNHALEMLTHDAWNQTGQIDTPEIMSTRELLVEAIRRRDGV